MTKFKFKSFKKKSGKLIPFSLKKSFPIKVKRIFIINGEKNFVRGDHAHKKCSQFFFPIMGKMKIEYINKKEKGKKILNSRKKEGFLLEPKNWCRVEFQSNNSILMVICDRKYEYRDYIENYKDFLKYIK